MQRLALFIAVAIASMGLAATSNAAGWSLTADSPLSYTFDKAAATIPASGSTAADWRNRSTSDVSGSKVMLIAPFHLGVGYEDYSFSQKVDFVTGGPPGTARITTNVRMYDVALDLPMRLLNVTLGGGTGSASSDVQVVAGGVGSPAPIHNADVSQAFLIAGIPMGASWDLHVGYHWVSIQNKDIVKPGQTGNFDKLQQSGQMLSAGLRLNF